VGKPGRSWVRAVPLGVPVGGAAFADAVTIMFGLTLTSTHGSLQDLFGVPLSPGDMLHGTFVYDPATARPASDPLYGGYGPVGSITVGAASSVQLPLQGIVVIDDRWDAHPDGFDYFGTFGQSTSSPGYALLESVLEFNAPTTGLRGSRLAQTAAEFQAAYTAGLFHFSGFAGESAGEDATHEFFGRVAVTPSAAATPEPGTLLLLATGAVAMAARRRRR